MIRNSNNAWGWPAIALHWIVAALVIATFSLGLWMDDLPRPERPYWQTIHASIGVTLMVILLARIAWALSNPTPAPVAGLPAWQQKAARFTHVSLYGLTLATVLFGWFLAEAKRAPVTPYFLGVVPLPPPLALPSAKDFLEESHGIAAYTLVSLAIIHVLAALWHHYVRRNDVLRRMLGRTAVAN